MPGFEINDLELQRGVIRVRVLRDPELWRSGWGTWGFEELREELLMEIGV